jgi:hypothetical protein
MISITIPAAIEQMQKFPIAVKTWSHHTNLTGYLLVWKQYYHGFHFKKRLRLITTISVLGNVSELGHEIKKLLLI